MAYSKTVWTNDTVPDIDEDNLNKIEQGIYDVTEKAEDLSNNLVDIITSNSVSFTSGKYINISNGSESNSGNYSVSDFVECEQGSVLFLYNVFTPASAAAYAFYKADKTYISGVSDVNGNGKIISVINIPENTKYVRFCSKSTDSRVFKCCVIDYSQVEKDINTLKQETNVLSNSNEYMRENLFNSKEASFISGYYININTTVGSTISLTPSSSNNYEYTLIPCKKNEKFIVTVHGGDSARAYGFVNDFLVLLEVSGSSVNLSNKVLYAPADGYFISNNKASFTGESVIYESNAITDKFPIVTADITDQAVEPGKTSFFIKTSKNMVNPANIITDKRFRTSTETIIDSSTDNYGSTGFIEVKEGETYTYSGTATTFQGGYFTESATLAVGQAGTKITFVDTPNNVGKSFTVPSNSNITKVLLTYDKTVEDGTLQLEVGDTASGYTPYNEVYKIPAEYLDVTGGDSVSDIVKLPTVIFDQSEKSKITDFISHWNKKDKDLMIVGVGTSLTARSRDHYTMRDDANKRPPLMDANNFCSMAWDKMKWDDQQYRRYDYPNFFTEVGTFVAARDVENWDEAGYRSGYTRYSDNGGSVSFEVPEDAWQFNFIYRTDSLGCESCVVSVAEGNGYMQVWNGSAWVEANDYTFSEREIVQYLENITAPNPNTVDNSNTYSFASYQISSNSMYQKRLKMRCQSHRDVTKTVTISASSDRFMYWGVEWSPREFMITYVNSARGSHNMRADSQYGLQHFQENEVWAFKPDIIFSENPIHNTGGSGSADYTQFHTVYWDYVTDDFFFNADSPISLLSRAEANGITGIPWILFTTSVTWNFNGITDDGELKVKIDADGHAMDAMEAQTRSYLFLKEYTDETVISINGCKYWCDACRQLFGDLKTATLGSGPRGNTLTDEGSHWNDKGNEVMAKCILPIFDFYH